MIVLASKPGFLFRISSSNGFCRNRKPGFKVMTVPQWSGMTLLFHTSVRSSSTPLKSRDMSTNLLCRKSVTVHHTQLSDYNTIAVLISQCFFLFAKLTIQTINSLYTNMVATFFIFSKMMVTSHEKLFKLLTCSETTTELEWVLMCLVSWCERDFTCCWRSAMSMFSFARSCLITCVSSWISEVGSPKRLRPFATRVGGKV